MTPLFILAIIVWGAVLVYAAPASWTVLSGGRVRKGDPMRLAVFTTATIIVAGSLRYIIGPDSVIAIAVIFALLIVDAFFILALMHAYGRGPHV